MTHNVDAFLFPIDFRRVRYLKQNEWLQGISLVNGDHSSDTLGLVAHIGQVIDPGEQNCMNILGW